jgi:putative transposase
MVKGSYNLVTFKLRREAVSPASSRPACRPKGPRDALLAFYNLPVEHWKHLHTNQRHRKFVRDGAPPHRALQGMSLEEAALAMIYQLAEAAEKSWRRLDGH